MSDLHEEYEGERRRVQMDYTRITFEAQEERRVISHPVAVLNPQGAHQNDRVQITSLDKLGLRTPEGEPIDKAMNQLVREAPGLFVVLGGVVYQKDRFSDQFFLAHPRLSSLSPEAKEEVIVSYSGLLDEAEKKLAAQIIRNQKNTPFSECEERDELTFQLHSLIEKAKQRGEPQTERYKNISSGPLKTTHTELTTAEGRSVWVDTDIYKQGSNGKFEQGGDFWWVSAKGPVDKVNAYCEERPGQRIRIATIVTVDRMYQLGEEVNSREFKETPTDRFWFRVKPGHGVPSDLEKETGMWGIGEATRYEWDPKPLPVNEYMVRKVIGELESALSHSSGGTS